MDKRKPKSEEIGQSNLSGVPSQYEELPYITNFEKSNPTYDQGHDPYQNVMRPYVKLNLCVLIQFIKDCKYIRFGSSANFDGQLLTRSGMLAELHSCRMAEICELANVDHEWFIENAYRVIDYP